MSKEIIGIGSETRPPVLVMGEYQQWKRWMIHFLDLLDENLMKSIREGPIRPTVTVAAVPRMDTCPELAEYVVEKPVDIVDSLTSARDVWLEIEHQMQGGDIALEDRTLLQFNQLSTTTCLLHIIKKTSTKSSIKTLVMICNIPMIP
ncbi:hypothetical protein OSB04_024641 [Centaurea solstitialis]|uniref:Uncharacterized protein n=1 Tax=Centaurea solstitialis TaxID=347529 RepID=A0AA38SLJ5_9ASTR|nr:hypothetical protein OSB04_024641 [Centaurea solstitialis]